MNIQLDFLAFSKIGKIIRNVQTVNYSRSDNIVWILLHRFRFKDWFNAPDYLSWVLQIT